MVFTSPTFLGFFLVFYALYLLLQRVPSVRPQNILLLIAGNVFYGAWDVRFLGLLWFSTFIDFFVAQRIAGAPTHRGSRSWLTFSLSVQIALLAVFKYLDFGIVNFAALLEVVGFEPHLHALRIILPVGISFYTFQTMAYTIDVYRGKVRPCTDLIDFATYVSYFPQLVAGPIETPGHLLPQIQRKRTITREGLRIGLYWVVIGFFKKVVIADTLAPLVEHVFTHTASLSGMSTLLGIVAFSLQIYGDFAGYTYIARGLAKWMGIDLAVNFRRPYLAISPIDFWRRWHISLSTWLRDYLYIPLGGSRKGPRRKYINLLLTMLIGGLWHGAAWNFVAWGLYHGVLLCIDHGLKDRALRIWPGHRPGHVLRIAGMYLLTLGGWLLFRVKTLDQAGEMLWNMVAHFRWDPGTGALALPVVTFAALLFTFHALQEMRADEFIVLRWRPLLRFGFYVFLVLSVIVVGLRPMPFIYFQF